VRTFQVSVGEAFIVKVRAREGRIRSKGQRSPGRRR
jgi:hypothetical protein